MPDRPGIDLAVNMQITTSIEKHNVFCLLAIFAALSVCFRRYWKGHSPRQTYMQHVARISKNVAPERFEPPTGRLGAVMSIEIFIVFSGLGFFALYTNVAVARVV